DGDCATCPGECGCATAHQRCVAPWRGDAIMTPPDGGAGGSGGVSGGAGHSGGGGSGGAADNPGSGGNGDGTGGGKSSTGCACALGGHGDGGAPLALVLGGALVAGT